MSQFDPLYADLKAAIESAPELRAVLTAGWLKWGLPPDAGFPCIRLDGLVCLSDKLGQYTVNLNLWAEQEAVSTDGFFTLSEALKCALDHSNVVPDGYLYRPDSQRSLHRALFPITFYLS